LNIAQKLNRPGDRSWRAVEKLRLPLLRTLRPCHSEHQRRISLFHSGQAPWSNLVSICSPQPCLQGRAYNKLSQLYSLIKIALSSKMGF